MHLERMGVKITIPGDKDPPKRKMGVDPDLPARLSPKEMIGLINKAGITQEIKDELIKMVKTYPANTMLHFYQNIHSHIAKIQTKLQEKNKKE